MVLAFYDAPPVVFASEDINLMCDAVPIDDPVYLNTITLRFEYSGDILFEGISRGSEGINSLLEGIAHTRGVAILPEQFLSHPEDMPGIHRMGHLNGYLVCDVPCYVFWCSGPHERSDELADIEFFHPA